MADQKEHETVNPESDTNDIDARLAEKNMVSEGAPPPEQTPHAVDADELDPSVKIEVATAEEENSVGENADEPEPAGEETVDPVDRLRAELAEAQAQADEYLDKMQRIAAEYQNSRRRQEKQMADEIERANGLLIKRLLPILDDFHLAFQNVPATLAAGDENEADQNGHVAEQAWVNGFRQIYKKVADTLTEQGLEMIPTTGKFDPTLHEPISSESSDTVESGHIIETLRAGYTYKGQVIRPALIRVAA